MTQMLEGTQELKSEIILSLDLLSSDNLQLLSKFVTFLRSSSEPEDIVDVANTLRLRKSRPLRITSPRLVHRHQAADFKKEIVECFEDDSI